MAQNGTYANVSEILRTLVGRREDYTLTLDDGNTCRFLIWELGGAEIASYLKVCREEPERAVINLVYLACKDHDGVRIFPDEQTVGLLPYRYLAELHRVADRLSAPTKGVEEAGKGSRRTPTISSTSRSRSRSATPADGSSTPS